MDAAVIGEEEGLQDASAARIYAPRQGKGAAPLMQRFAAGEQACQASDFPEHELRTVGALLREAAEAAGGSREGQSADLSIVGSK